MTPASFTLGEGNRVTGDQLVALLSGKQVGFVRRHDSSPGFERRFSVYFRSDGSFSSRCEIRAVGATSWAECPSIDDNRSRGGREAGVWHVAGGKLCVGRLRNQDEVCYTFYRDGGRYYLQQASGGAACMPGDVSIQ